MLVPESKDIVLMKDGRLVYVTDVADQRQSEYYAVHPTKEEPLEYFDGPVETIFVGRLVDPFKNDSDWVMIDDRAVGLGGTVVSDFSEIKGINPKV